MRTLWVTLAATCLVACQSEPVKPASTEDVPTGPIVMTRLRVRKHKAQPKIEKPKIERRFSQADLNPEPSREEKLQLVLKIFDKAINKGDLKAAKDALKNPSHTIPAWEDILTAPQSETEKDLGAKYVASQFISATGLPKFELYDTTLSPCHVQTDLGGDFPAFIREDYQGQADSEERSSLDLIRLDGIETTIPKATIAYKRLSPKAFRPYVRDFLNKRQRRVGADRPIGAYKLYAMAAKFSALPEAYDWLTKAIKIEGSEVIIGLNVRESKQQEMLTTLFRQLTNEASKVSVELVAFVEKVQTTELKTDDENNAPDSDSKANKMASKKDKTDSQKTGSKKTDSNTKKTEDENSPGGTLIQIPAKSDDILRTFKEGVKHYRLAKDKGVEQRQLRKAQQYFDAAFEAWNQLSERKPEAAAKLEARVSEMGVLQYDIIKRLKL